MSLWNLLILVALASSVVLLTQRCLYAVAAVLASGLWSLIAFGVLDESSRASVPVMFAAISGAVGAVAFVRSSEKVAVGAAAVLAAFSGVQLVMLLELL